MAESRLTNACYTSEVCLAAAATHDIDAVPPTVLRLYIGTLSRLGLFKQARRAASRLDPGFAHESANEDIAVGEIVNAARSSPDKVADLVALDALTQPGVDAQPIVQAPQQYDILAHALLYRSSVDHITTDVASVFRNAMLIKPPNATLIEILNLRWPDEIRRLPSTKQGGDWDALAQLWQVLGDKQRAAQALDQAESAGMIDFRNVQIVYDSTWRTWLKLGNFKRALAAVDRLSDRSFAGQARLEIARALLKSGDKGETKNVLHAALSAIQSDTDASRKMELLYAVEHLSLEVGDIPAARDVAQNMSRLAYDPHTSPHAPLLPLAAAFNDIGDYATATKISLDALSRLHKALGPLSHAPGFAHDHKAAIAQQLYRSGDKQDFDALLAELSPDDQSHLWASLCNDESPGNWIRPSAEKCAKNPDIKRSLHLAVTALQAGETNVATGHLETAYDTCRQDASPACIGLLLNIARLADVAGSQNLTDAALVTAARSADSLENIGAKEVWLANVAALRKELH